MSKIYNVQTFVSAPVMSGASISSGTIPITSVVGTAMDISSAQTVNGIKTFTSAPVMSGASISSGTIPIASVVGTAMDLTTAQTVGGNKTFSNNVVLNGSLQYSTGATNGYYLQSDGSGNASWAAVTTTPTSWSQYPALQNVDMDLFAINNLANPSSAQDAATKNYVDTSAVLLTGAQSIDGVKTFTSAPVMSGASISSGTIDAAAVNGVAATLSGQNAFTGTNTFDSALPTSTVTPVNPQDLITKAYADATYEGASTATVTTTDANNTALITYSIPSNSGVTIDADIFGISSTFSDATGGKIVVTARNNGGTGALVGTSFPIVNADSTGSFNASVNGTTLTITVAGLAATTYNWKAMYTTVVN